MQHGWAPMKSMDTASIIRELMQARPADDSLAQFGSLTSAHQYLKAYRLAQQYVPPGGKVLDWGAGSGHFSYFLVRAGFETSGFGFGQTPAICKALAPGQYVYRQASLGPVALPFDDARFDAVFSIGVLEHVSETGGSDRASLREIHRILKPGGHFVCFHLPNRYSWIEMLARLVRKWSHSKRYTRQEILALAAPAGFDLLELRRYAALPRNIWWGKFGRTVTGSPATARLYDILDDLLAAALGPICQNYLFVARKQASSVPRSLT